MSNIVPVTEEVQIEEATIDQRQYFIVDTPGFDMDKEVDVFYKINRGIQDLREHIRTWGILYVTKLDSRVETIDEKLLDFVRCFSGKQFIVNITFVTTHWFWNHEKEKRAKIAQLEYRTTLWEHFLNNGARMYHRGRKVIDGADVDDCFSWYGDRDQIAESAKCMVSDHYGRAKSLIPSFVQELNDGIATHMTTAGSMLEPPSRQSDFDDYVSFREDPGASWDEIPAEFQEFFFDHANNEEAQEQQRQATDPPPQPHQPATEAPRPEPDVLNHFLNGGWREYAEFTFDGPPVAIRNGRISLNCTALTRSVWQALSGSSSVPAPNQGKLIDLFLS